MSESGIFLPIHAGAAVKTPIEAVWLSGDCVAQGVIATGVDTEVGPLQAGLYAVWVENAAWVNAGEGRSADPAVVGADAAKPHPGGYWAVAIADGEKIWLRGAAAGGAYRIFDLGQPAQG